MKKGLKYGVILLSGFLCFTSCNNSRKPDPSMNSSPMMTGFPASSNNSEIATRELDTDNDNGTQQIDYYGTYEGVLPAADAGGITTTLTLYNDNTFKLEQVYEGKEADNAFEERGKYYVTGTMLTLQANNEEEFYRIEDNSILKLDNEKQVITGNLAENYRLTKK